MKHNASIVVAVAVASILAGGATAGQVLQSGKCVKVIDGDTVVIDCDHNRRTVNIDGIDAPELDQPWGKEVRSFVKGMLKGKEVEVEIVDSSGDTVRARVFVDGVDLSEMLVSRGLAWVPEDSSDSELVSLGNKARELPCGLWIDPDPQAPWEFRAAG